MNMRNNENARLAFGPRERAIGLRWPAQGVDVDLRAQRAALGQARERRHEKPSGEHLVLAVGSVAVLNAFGGAASLNLGCPVAGSSGSNWAGEFPRCTGEHLAHLIAILLHGELKILNALAEALDFFLENLGFVDARID